MNKSVRPALEKPENCQVFNKDDEMMRSQSANTIGARGQVNIPHIKAGYMTAVFSRFLNR